MDAQIKAHVTFYDVLHGFRAKWGCWTAIIEAKLLQQLAGLEQSMLFHAFLDLGKAYDALDRERALEIFDPPQLLGSTNGRSKTEWILWGTFCCRQRSHSGRRDLPDAFYLVGDAVVQYWLSLVSDTGEDANTGGVGLNAVKRATLFYADDGAISSRDM
jgi:hypothetical protein